MTTISETPALLDHLTPAASAALGHALGDAPEVAELRRSAAAFASKLPLPTRLERPWRYTPVSRLLPANLQPSAGPATTPPTNDGTVIELVDGGTVQHTTVQGVEIGGASVAVGQLGSILPADTNLLTALHYAFMDGLLVISVPDDVEVAVPLRIRRKFLRAGGLAAPHTLIVTGKHARLTVIEECVSSDDPMTVLAGVEIKPGPGAEVRYVVLHHWGAATNVFAEQRTDTSPDSAVVSVAVATGGALVKSHVTSTLNGRGSSSEIFALFLGRSTRQFDLFTTQDHVGADTRSDLLYKSALRDDAKSVYYGVTKVGLNARNADANQENRNLLLSKTAKAESDPVLEILTNNVIKAAHGATAGPVDESQLFYLEARGLTREAAEELLVGGFLGQVLDRIPDPVVRGELNASLGLAAEVSL